MFLEPRIQNPTDIRRSNVGVSTRSPGEPHLAGYSLPSRIETILKYINSFEKVKFPLILVKYPVKSWKSST